MCRNCPEGNSLTVNRPSTQYINPLAVHNTAVAECVVTLPFEDKDCDACIATVEQAMRGMNRAVARERTMVQALQSALLPCVPARWRDLDLAVRYQAADDAAHVGGDFYDIFPLEENTVALAVGDVAGAGLAAAAQVTIIRHMLRYALYSRVSLADAVGELNMMIADHHLLETFATLFVGIYDSEMRSLTYVSCGHEPVLLLRGGACGKAELLEHTGPVLGAFMTGEYGENDVELFHGDTLLIYTDGLSECGPNRGEILKISGIIQLLHQKHGRRNAAELADHILDGAKLYSGNGFQDDVCLIAAKIDTD